MCTTIFKTSGLHFQQLTRRLENCDRDWLSLYRNLYKHDFIIIDIANAWLDTLLDVIDLLPKEIIKKEVCIDRQNSKWVRKLKSIRKG